MAHLTDYKLQKILTRFPWRRRKPRGSKRGVAPISMTTKEGQRLWADPGDLVAFEDPGPALVCIAMQSEALGRMLVGMLVMHHAEQRGISLPDDVPEVTTVGLEILMDLIEASGLDPDEPLGAHPIGELLTATWALAAPTEAREAV